MNYCPECGAKLSEKEKYENRCLACAKPTELAIVGKTDVSLALSRRKLPTNDEERAEAYFRALSLLELFFRSQGFDSYAPDNGTLMVGKGLFLLDVKIVPNDGRTAYVTSGPKYNPTKAGKKDSGATVITTRTVMKASNLLRVSVSDKMSASPVFVELRKNIPDPLVHICQAVMAVFQESLNPNSGIGREIRDVSVLKDVPPEWLPGPGQYDELFGIPSDENC